MISAAQAAGLRVALWNVPYIEDAAASAALLGEAEDNGYFPPEYALLTSDWGKPIDFTNPDAYAWWQQHIHKYTDMGIEGFKLDYAEDITVGLGGARTVWEFADGSSERTMHKLYAPLYHRVYAETLPKTGGFLLARAGTYGDQKNVSVIWPGDLDATMDRHGDDAEKDGEQFVAVGGLPAAVTASLSLGPSGFPFFASDTGGYRHSPPDRETFTRWFEYTALTPVMQVGDSASDVPWEFTPENGFDEVMLAWYRDYARLHMRLFPYVWTHAQRLASDGRPLQRPLGLAYPELGVHPSDVYLLGDALLVAPVVERGATSRKLTLAPGVWVDWWTGEVIEGGGEIEVAAPLETLPLFVRGGAIVPMLRPTIDSLAPTTTPDTVDSFAEEAGALYVRVVAAAKASEFAVYDGTTLTQQLGEDALSLAITPGDVFKEGAWFEVITAPKVDAVLDGGTPLAQQASLAALAKADSGWAVDKGLGGTLAIKVGPGQHTLTAQRSP
jgi:alpha-D-xyloside xylohydrolase